MPPAKRVFLLAISFAYLLLRMGYRLIGRRIQEHEPVVITYHSLSSEDIPHFERQMRYLKRRAATIFADSATHSCGRPTVAVTFDDGFQNTFDLALPILARLSIPATIFVPTAGLGDAPGWIARQNRRSQDVGRIVTANTLAVADTQLVRIGSHTVTHPRLADVEDATLEAELTGSKLTLELLTGTRISMLALPYGSYSPKVIASACRAGYERVFCNVPLSRTITRFSPLVGRVNVTPRDWLWEFKLKINGGYGWMAAAIPVKRKVLELLPIPKV
jgi:peptidoglycan/xylan/chitin deacetylase (PgdA/CDA1 family)